MNDLPLNFFHLGLDASQYFMSDDHSFRGPCIQCGGHRRMVTFINGKFPQWWMRCDLCGLEGWVWQFFDLTKIVDGEMDLGPSTEGMIDKLNSETMALARFETERIWDTYHDNLTDDRRQWWRDSGVPDDWQDFWGVGFTPEHIFVHNHESYARPAFTIPKFDVGWTPTNLDYRIVDPPLGVGKYRPYYGLPARSFIARPDFDNFVGDGRVVIVEGSKKAMVLAVNLGIQVIGIPGCKSWLDLIPKIQTYRPRQLVVVLDPDATKAAWALAARLNATQLSIPAKPDDAFLRGWLDENSFWRMVKESGRQLHG